MSRLLRSDTAVDRGVAGVSLGGVAVRSHTLFNRVPKLDKAKRTPVGQAVAL
jgi:hypothetical protein